MKKARFTEEQIIGVLWEHEAGAATADALGCNERRERNASDHDKLLCIVTQTDGGASLKCRAAIRRWGESPRVAGGLKERGTAVKSMDTRR